MSGEGSEVSVFEIQERRGRCSVVMHTVHVILYKYAKARRDYCASRSIEDYIIREPSGQNANASGLQLGGQIRRSRYDKMNEWKEVLLCIVDATL